MPHLVGQITDIDHDGKSTSGKNKKFSVRIDDGGDLGDRWFGAFSKPLVAGFDQGDYVDVMYTEAPNRSNPDFPYLNIDAMTKVEGQDISGDFNHAGGDEQVKPRSRTVDRTPGPKTAAGEPIKYKQPDTPAVQLSFQIRDATNAALTFAQMQADPIPIGEVMENAEFILKRWVSLIYEMKDNLDDPDFQASLYSASPNSIEEAE